MIKSDFNRFSTKTQNTLHKISISRLELRKEYWTPLGSDVFHDYRPGLTPQATCSTAPTGLKEPEYPHLSDSQIPWDYNNARST